MKKKIYLLCLLCQSYVFGYTQKAPTSTSEKTVAPYIEILKQRMRVGLKRNKRAPSKSNTHMQRMQH